MPRKQKFSNIHSNYIQLEMNFDEILSQENYQVLDLEQINSYDLTR